MAAIDITALRALAARRDGVISRAQALGMGLSHVTIRTRIASGAWDRIGRALILHDVARPGDRQQAWILTANISDGAIVTGPLAARLGGWDVPGSELLFIDADHRPAGIPGTRLIRRIPSEVTRRRDGLRLAHRLDALADTLIHAPGAWAADLLDLSLQRRWIDVATLDRVVAERAGHGHRGVGVLRHLRARAASGSRSEAEHRMAVLLRHVSGTWVANYTVRDPQRRIVAEIDFANRQHRIAIEVDGRAFHTDHRSFERDRVRQNILVLLGWTILRFTWEQIINDPAGVIATINAACAYAAARAAT